MSNNEESMLLRGVIFVGKNLKLAVLTAMSFHLGYLDHKHYTINEELTEYRLESK